MKSIKFKQLYVKYIYSILLKHFLKISGEELMIHISESSLITIYHSIKFIVTWVHNGHCSKDMETAKKEIKTSFINISKYLGYIKNKQ